jgi:hypothetical protein
MLASGDYEAAIEIDKLFRSRKPFPFVPRFLTQMTEHAYMYRAEAGCTERNGTSIVQSTEKEILQAEHERHQTGAWKRFKQSCAAARSAARQRIAYGRQCRPPVKIWHNLMSPCSRPDHMLSSKVNQLCRLAEIHVPTKAPVIKS